MSYRLVDMVLESSLTDATETAVMIALASHADKYCSCYPSIARLAKLSRYKDRAVQSALKRLSARGVISVKVGGGRGGASFYTINPAALKPAADAPFQPENPAADAPFLGKKPRSRNTVSDDKTPHLKPETPHLTTENPAADAPEPVIEPIKKKQPPPESPAQLVDFQLVPKLTQALGFDLHGVIPKYWITPDAALIAARWQTDLGLTAEEVIHVAVQSMKVHGTPAEGPKALVRAMQDYAAAKNAPPLEPTQGGHHAQGRQPARPDRGAAAADDALRDRIEGAVRNRSPSKRGICFD
ncbi:helix-turn-helix domain-containing protein [Paracoccus hibiscisoli]|uniref:Helix-turn-helix domain-containing protein n=1 Tax=Paracoccus hibiscisoli TaxID=2023261 RepID=A0A4U0QUP9_9RHOB|nr:helix-turn-helix domain-containing protein [Paracoccus hibiscisoli]TJZ85815.1 helix-turn-helix domain-containing protein [Paracoccus hibiscisoli]